MNRIHLIILFLLGVNYHHLHSQVTQPPDVEQPLSSVSLIAKSFGDSIVLRWAPTHVDAWLAGNAYGYNIYRYKAAAGEEVLSRPERIKLNTAPILPLQLDEIEAISGGESYPAIVAQAIYGQTFNVNSHSDIHSLADIASVISNRFSFALFACDMSVNASRAHGLIYSDKNIEKDVKYLYCVKPCWKDTLSQSDSACILIATADTFSVPSPALVFARAMNNTVEISWDRIGSIRLFSAFVIERSSDGGNTYVRISKSPVVNTSNNPDTEVRRFMYINTIPEYNKVFKYRVRGITPFGEISKPSDPVSVEGKEIIIGLNPMIVSFDRKINSSIELFWEFPEDIQEKLKGFIIERSDKVDGHYSLISDTLHFTSRSFTDPNPLNTNYYQVCAISNSDNSFCSFPSLVHLIDSIPPAIPEGLAGDIDSLGAVTLTWVPNKETDLSSYSVYRSFNPEKDFVKINGKAVENNFFRDTLALNNLTGIVYYAVSAQDKNYNESPRSEAVMLTKPDTIPPVPPRLVSFNAGINSIEFDWIRSSSSDVDLHEIHRREVGNIEWELILSDRKHTVKNHFKDSLLSPGTEYEYSIIASDRAGLKSDASITSYIKTRSAPAGETEIRLNLSASEDKKSVIISWNIKQTGISKVMIYKSSEANEFALIQCAKFDQKQIFDHAVKQGYTYHYFVQGVDSSGKKLKIGKTFSITL